MKSRYNPVLLAIIVVGLVCALYLNWTRHEIEQRNDTVEMAMEYENLRKLAALEGLPEETVLREFREAGVTSLMIFDTTLERLYKNGVVTVATGGDLRKALALGTDSGIFKPVLAAGGIVENAAYIAAGDDKEAFRDLISDLRLRYGAERVTVLDTAPQIIRVLGSTALVPEDKYDEPLGLLQAPLGLPAADMRRVAALGFNVIVRPQNYTEVNEEKIDSIFNRIAESGVRVHAYMPCGTQVVGYPDKIDYMGKKMGGMGGMKLVMLEHYTQLRFANIEGLIPLAENVDYNAARSYVIDPLEQKKISVGEALRRWALTDEERNIRVNYVRPFLQSKNGEDLLALNLKYVHDITRSVEERGYKIGEAGVFSTYSKGMPVPYFPEKVWLIPVIAAIVAGCVLYLALLVPLSGARQLALWGVLTLAAAAIVMLGRGLLARQMLALGAAAVFPVLSMSVIFNIWDKIKNFKQSVFVILGNAIWQLALAIGASLIGAALLSAILTDSRFWLEIDIYRGVKLTFILPLVLTAALYIKRYDLLDVMGRGVKAAISRISNLLDTGLTFKHVVILGVLLFIVYYFVGRSGHTGGVPVPAIELKMRAFLEQVMYARPREKEFMIGHPAFFMAGFAAYKGAPRLWQFVLVCAAVIGQGSLVQTFCHMRTPVVMSFVRALDGYAVGVVFGVLGVLIVAAALPYLLKLRRRYLE